MLPPPFLAHVRHVGEPSRLGDDPAVGRGDVAVRPVGHRPVEEVAEPVVVVPVAKRKESLGTYVLFIIQGDTSGCSLG